MAVGEAPSEAQRGLGSLALQGALCQDRKRGVYGDSRAEDQWRSSEPGLDQVLKPQSKPVKTC